MPTGAVKWFDQKKGFGFITPHDGGPELFVHHSAVDRVSAMNPGQEVEFDVENAPKGPKAVNVSTSVTRSG